MYIVYIDAVMKDARMGMRKMRVKFLEEEERMEINWSLMCRLFGFMGPVKKRPKGNGRTFC